MTLREKFLTFPLQEICLISNLVPCCCRQQSKTYFKNIIINNFIIFKYWPKLWSRLYKNVHSLCQEAQHAIENKGCWLDDLLTWAVICYMLTIGSPLLGCYTTVMAVGWWESPIVQCQNHSCGQSGAMHTCWYHNPAAILQLREWGRSRERKVNIKQMRTAHVLQYMTITIPQTPMCSWVCLCVCFV